MLAGYAVLFCVQDLLRVMFYYGLRILDIYVESIVSCVEFFCHDYLQVC